MDVCLQAHGEKLVYPVPTGLHELMSDISREVLREQPTDIYRFIWNYLESIYKLREVTKCATHFVDNLIETSTEEVNFLRRYNVSREVAHNAATIIQNAFNIYKLGKRLKKRLEEERFKKEEEGRDSTLKFLSLNNISIKDAVGASIVIQKYFRKYRASKESDDLKMLLPTLSSDKAMKGSSQLLQDSLQKKANKRLRDPNKLVYEQSPQSSVLSTWSTMELFEPRTQAYKLVVDRAHPTKDLPQTQKASSIKRKVDMTFFTPSGDIMGKTSDTVFLMSKEMDRLEEQTKTMLYPPVPDEFFEMDFTRDESVVGNRYALPQKPQQTFKSTVSKDIFVGAPQIEEKLLDMNELYRKASETRAEDFDMLEIDERTPDIPKVSSKDGSIKSLEETSSVTKRDSKGSKRSSKADDVAETLEEAPTIPREDSAPDENVETPDEITAPPISVPDSNEPRTSSRLSAAELLDRVSKSSLSAEPRRSSNVSASELLERVSKSSVAKSVKSASETSKKESPINGQNEEADLSTGDHERHSETNLQEVTEEKTEEVTSN